eukprot:COSAG06_NODE_6632_length_2847_cov_2.585153_2_plen_55_part_00
MRDRGNPRALQTRASDPRAPIGHRQYVVLNLVLNLVCECLCLLCTQNAAVRAQR